MSEFLDYRVTKMIDSDVFTEDQLKFLEFSGRQTLYSQGYFGQGITVAVIDTGVSKHEEFDGNRLLRGYNVNTSGSYSGSNTTDDAGHGTHVAGSIAGKNVGIAPKANILPIKVLDGSGSCNISDVASGIRKAITWRGNNGDRVKIISMSLSFNEKDATKAEIADLHQAIKDADAVDVLVVCSGGNTAKEETKRYPSTFEEVVAVGAVDVDKQQAYFSSMGDYLDLCQIGVDVLSAWHKGGYAYMSGTSMSTPIVSGIAALLACKYKEQFGTDIPARKLYEALKLNTKDMGIPGVDKLFGAGFCSLQPIDMEIVLTQGKDIMEVNGEEIKIDAPPQLIEGRWFVPLRWIVTYLGGYISFDRAEYKAKFKF